MVQLLWAIDAAGLVMATALLALKYFRAGHDLVARNPFYAYPFLVMSAGSGASCASMRQSRFTRLFPLALSVDSAMRMPRMVHRQLGWNLSVACELIGKHMEVSDG